MFVILKFIDLKFCFLFLVLNSLLFESTQGTKSESVSHFKCFLMCEKTRLKQQKLVSVKAVTCVFVAVDVVIEPSTSQFFKYQRFSVSCSADEQEQEVSGWTVMKRTKDGEVGPANESSISAAEVYYPQFLSSDSSLSVLLRCRRGLPRH